MHGHVSASSVKHWEFVGALPDTAILNLQIGLALRNEVTLDSLMQGIYDPTSPTYHRYLTPEQFTEMFGPTEQDYQTVIDFMQARGLRVIGTYPNRVVIDVSSSVANIEKTFHVNMGIYRDPSKPRTFYAPDVVATIDSLDVSVLDVIGIDDYAPPRPIDLKKPKSGEKPETNGSGPGGLFIGNDYRAAYAPGVSLDGTGQIVGLFEFGPYWTNDVTTYEGQAGLPHVKITNVLLDGFTGVPGASDDVGEESLDIENALSMAPGASFIVYEGNNAVDILSRIASDDKAKQISCSFGWYPPSLTENKLYEELDAQGQGFYVASGDGGAYADTVQIFSPTDNPNITCVGGTYLVTNGPGGDWISETAWNGSSGGISQTFLCPNYQIGIGNSSNQGSKTYRNIPDVSATAAFQFYFVYNDGSSGGIGGTSGSAPLWTGFTALINQQAAANSKPGAGFINPALYSIGKGSSFSYNPDFHDITSGNNFNTSSPSQFSAGSGYDLVTGWGTPNGIYTINALAGITTPDFSLSTSPDSLIVNQLSKDQFTIAIRPLNGFKGNLNLSASNLPSGVTASFGSSNSAGSSILTLTTSLEANTGTSTITITGVSDSLTHSISVGLTVNAAPTATTKINLLHYFNKFGIIADSAKFSGGLDNDGYAYSKNLLGNSVAWNNTLFNIGNTNSSGANVVSAEGQNVVLPSGKFAGLRMLATGVNGNQTKQQFKVIYTDTAETITQSFSDWFSPANYPDENIAVTMPYRVTANGGMDNSTFYLYGYSFNLDAKRTISSISLPVNQNLEILAMTLAAPVTDTLLSANTFTLEQNYP
ncbi:MAG: S53 family peptidase, partial [Candidatus Kryptoniota bacterium]